MIWLLQQDTTVYSGKNKMENNVKISDDYHDIGRLLLITIIVSSKNCMISIIV